MKIDDFTKEARDVAQRVIGSVMDVSDTHDSRSLLLGGYLSAHPTGGQDLTEDMLDSMVEALATARASLNEVGVFEFK